MFITNKNKFSVNETIQLKCCIISQDVTAHVIGYGKSIYNHQLRDTTDAFN